MRSGRVAAILTAVVLTMLVPTTVARTAAAAPLTTSAAASSGVATVDVYAGRYSLNGTVFDLTGTFAVGAASFVGEVSGVERGGVGSTLSPFEIGGLSLGHALTGTCDGQILTPLPDPLVPDVVYSPQVITLRCTASIDGSPPGALSLVVLLGPGAFSGDATLSQIHYMGVFAGSPSVPLLAQVIVDGLSVYVTVDPTQAVLPGNLVQLCLTAGSPDNRFCVNV